MRRFGAALVVLVTLLVWVPPAAAGTLDSARQTLIRQHARVLFPYWPPAPLASWTHASLFEYPCGSVRCIEVDFGTGGSVISLVRESRSNLQQFLSPAPAARVWHVVSRKRINGQTIYVASDGVDRELVWYRGQYGYQVGSLNLSNAWKLVKALTPLGHEWIASLPNGGKLVMYATGPYARGFSFDYTLGWSPAGDDYPNIENLIPVPSDGSISDSNKYTDSTYNHITYSLAGTLSWNASIIQGTFQATDGTGDSVNTTWQAYSVG
jgi:hypothetical protein